MPDRATRADGSLTDQWPEAVGNARAILVSAADTPFGPFLVASSDGYVIGSAGPGGCGADPLAWARLRWTGAEIAPAASLHDLWRTQVDAYFAGTQQAFDVPMRLHGRLLDVRAWEAARAIPYGMALTYGELAWDAGAPGAARAMGRAMTICPLPLLIPCHRVIGAGNKPCGGMDGWRRRQALLDFERQQLGLQARRTNRRVRGPRPTRSDGLRRAILREGDR